MKYKITAILLSILSIIFIPVTMVIVIGAFSQNILLGIICLFIFSVDGVIYKKALNCANKSQSKLIILLVKYITPLLIAGAVFISIIGIGYIVQWMNS